ncbi:MAG: GNAT family N-acetyltransferase [Anaerolineales bacterium]
MGEIEYRIGNDLDLDQVIGLYRSSTLAERRPIDKRDCMAQMIAAATLVVTAWDGDQLVGIARSLTDTCYVAYLADLAVDQSYQHQGIGRELVHRTRSSLGDQAMIVLLAAPAAVDYYPRIGFKHHPQAWILTEEDDLT